MTVDLRWFASNPLTRLVVPGLSARGYRIALEGDARAAAVVCLSAKLVEPAWRYARRHGVPLGFYLWDLPPWRLAEGRPDPVIDFGGRLLPIPRPWGRFAERPNYYSRLIHVLRHAKVVWVPSRQTAADLERLTGVVGVHLPYCYDSDRFVPDATPRAPRTIVAVSRLVPSKGFDLLLKAAASLDPRPTVRIIGRGALAGALEAEARGLGLSATIETSCDDPGVVDAYRRATVVACPSRFEGFGLTGIEGLACGAPVVASDISPHREFLGSHATYAPVGDVPALTRALAAALTAPRPPVPDLSHLGIAAAVDRFAAALPALLTA